MTTPRTGCCVACKQPLAEHFNARNHFIDCDILLGLRSPFVPPQRAPQASEPAAPGRAKAADQAAERGTGVIHGW